MVELYKLIGDKTKLGTCQHRLKITCESLRQLQTGKGYFCKSMEPDGTKHGVLGQEKYAYLEGVANADALAFRVADDQTAVKIYDQIAAVLGVTWAVETFLQRGPRFLHMDRSWHGETLCGGWHMRDKDLAGEWRRFMADDYPRLVYDNGRDNPCLYGDAVELATGIKADAAYFDPPYAGVFSAYKGSYDLVDDWTKDLLGAGMPPDPAGQPSVSPLGPIPPLIWTLPTVLHRPNKSAQDRPDFHCPAVEKRAVQ